MRKGLDSPPEATILMVAGVLFVMVVLVFGSKTYAGVAYGQCWQKTDESLSSLKSEIQSQKLAVTGSLKEKVYVGECIGGVIIFNKGFSDKSADTAFQSFVSSMEKQYCPNANDPKNNIFKSYILMFPWKTLKEQQNLNSWQKAWNTFSDATKLEVFQKPDCIGVELPLSTGTYYIPPDFSKDPNKIENLNQKAGDFCYTLSRVSDQYTLTPEGLALCPDKIS